MNDLPDDTPSDAERKMQFLYALRSKGVTDKLVLGAMEAIDRGPFIRGLFAELRFIRGFSGGHVLLRRAKKNGASLANAPGHLRTCTCHAPRTLHLPA